MNNSHHLSSRDYAAIGVAVYSFSQLEHEIVRATIGICGGPKNISDTDKTKIEKSLDSGAALHSRVELFCGLARKRNQHTNDEIQEFERKVKEGVFYRNLICHGQWEKVSSDKLKVTFYNKGCVARGYPEIGLFSPEELADMAQLTLGNAELLSKY